MTTQSQKDAAVAAIQAAVSPVQATGDAQLVSITGQALSQAQSLAVFIPPAGAESPDPTEGISITDENGDVWALNATLITKNTQWVFGWKASNLYWKARVLYCVGSSGNWLQLNRVTGGYTPVPDPRDSAPPPPVVVPPPSGSYDPKNYLTITTPATLVAKRASFIAAEWVGGLPTSRPTITTGVTAPFSVNAARVDRWQTSLAYNGSKMYTSGYCFRPFAPNGKAVILMPGHNASISARNFDLLTQSLLNANITVVVHWMVLYGENYSAAGYGSHDQMAAIGGIIAPFVDHYLVSVNQLISEGFAVNVLGLSGGGWASSIISAAEPRIRVSYDVAGSQPLALWPVAPAVIGGDWEQLQGLGSLSYEDLYLMASAQGSKHVQGCNTRDLYFSGTKYNLYQPEISARAIALGGTFAVHSYTTPIDDHTLDSTVRAAFLADL